MPRRATPLTAIEVRTAKPGAHVDGGGLMLVVQATGAASWLIRYTVAGKRREMGLGPARGPNAVSLADARVRAADVRRAVAQGDDPLAAREAREAAERAAAEEARREAAAGAVTFRLAADRYIAAHEAGWRNPKHRAQWVMTLREYAGPHMGALPVGEVETRHVEAALRPHWLERPETATRLRGRIEAVLDFAAVQGWRSGPNPARWRGHLDKLFPRRAKVRATAHHAALPWQEVPAFLAALRERDGASARALEFLILTAARSGEVMGARWSEIDMEGAVWTVPAARMKAGREHRVPLTEPALAVLRHMLPLRPSGARTALVFPGQREGRPLSVMALAMTIRRMNAAKGGPRWHDGGGDEITPHGFRSSFRDWAGETTAHPREVVEHALAHLVGGAVERAYARGDLFQKRRKLMEDWAAFVGRPPAEVVPLRPGEAAADA